MRGYSIYIIFPGDPDTDEGDVRVYAGRVIGENEAIERARAILNERDGGARAVEVIGGDRPGTVSVRRVDPGAAAQPRVR